MRSSEKKGHAYECMMDGNCRRVFADCEAAGRCLAATPSPVAVERAAEAVRSCPSLDENGYICTKDAAIKAILAKQPAATRERDPSDARFEQKLRDEVQTWKPKQYHASDMAFVLRLLDEARAAAGVTK